MDAIANMCLNGVMLIPVNKILHYLAL